MFRSLQARLILSYAAVILVVLVLVSLAAMLLLRSYQQEQVFLRLEDRKPVAVRLLAEVMARGVQLPQAAIRVSSLLGAGNGRPVFVYLLDAGGWVVAGSDKRLNGQRFEQLAARAAPLPPRAQRGERLLGESERLLYIAERLPVPAESGPAQRPHTLVLAQAWSPERLAWGRLLPRLIWTGTIGLALALLLAGLIAYSIARPLERIARAAEEIAAGNYDQELDITAPLEVARLAGSFNRMARQVKSALQSQQDLVANVSHELKTPLTSIQGFSQALLDGTAAGAEAQQRAAAIIHEEAGRMRHLVDELLDLARLEAGQVHLARQAVDVGELLHDVEQRFAPQLSQAGVALELQVAPGLPAAAGDAARLAQVVGNLVDNALKYSRGAAGGGHIVLRADAGPVPNGQVLVTVTDNGPGIAAEKLPRLFERFYQVDRSRARPDGARRTGAGLGLAIAREIVEAHGGQIGVESVEGLGTRLKVTLPAWSEQRTASG